MADVKVEQVDRDAYVVERVARAMGDAIMFDGDRLRDWLITFVQEVDDELAPVARAAIAALATGRDDKPRFWLSIREPGCVPQRKGSWPLDQTAKVLREFMEARPTAYIDYITVDSFGCPEVQHGPEVLQMADGRSMGTGTAHNSRVREAEDALRASTDERNAVIEECAKVAKSHQTNGKRLYGTNGRYDDAVEEVSQAIRALKDAPDA